MPSDRAEITIKDIKPGHPIWDEVWEKSRPGGTNHLEQLFAAKLEVERMRGLLRDTGEHLRELADAFRTGALTQHDNGGGTRSNRNHDLLQKVDAELGEK